MFCFSIVDLGFEEISIGGYKLGKFRVNVGSIGEPEFGSLCDYLTERFSKNANRVSSAHEIPELIEESPNVGSCQHDDGSDK